MKNFYVVLRISLALSTLTATATLLAYALGLIPDHNKLELAARAKFTEALAIQLISAISHNDFVVIKDTIKSVVGRNNQVRSIAIKKADGSVLAASESHDKFWIPTDDQTSSPTQINVPILKGKENWGSVEIALGPLPKSNSFLGISIFAIGFMAFIFVGGFAGNFFVLRRTLKALDPASVIPDRVQKAFNTLAEGVVVIDDGGSILLANSSFSEDLGVNTTALLGHKIDQLPWVNQVEEQQLPWLKTMEGNSVTVESRLSMYSHSGETINYSTNSTQITDPNDKIVGAIVTFDDVTDLEYKNAELNKMVTELQKKDTEIRLKNRELHILATKDPLTNCLNRRAFFDGFNEGLESIVPKNTSVCCMMIDLDKFKKVNDTYGHSIGDQVIVLMGNILKSAVGSGDVAGRYGGEEFCVVRFGYSQADNLAIAEKIRTSIIEHSKRIAALREPITTSIGVAT
ncbi:MAG: sensor domain-containing diguanylate cyclase, partial [Hyphomicrobiales bacterium]|nr:sensor domain-containing diguanylate cyclase [Hyphomicrobiales bacterium]